MKNTFRHATSPWRTLPAFLVVGTRRGGTTALLDYLYSHPKITTPDCNDLREINFFSSNFHRGVSWYAGHFPFTDGVFIKQRFTGACCPYDLFHPHAPRRTAEILPNAKVIALLRDPVSRALSDFVYHRNRGWITEESFEDAWSIERERLPEENQKLLEDPKYQSRTHATYSFVERGRYSRQIARWSSQIPPSQILLVQSEQLFSQPQRILPSVLDFLGLDYSESAPFRRLNQSSDLSNQPTPWDRRIKEQLQEQYFDDNQSLYRLLGTNAWWDEQGRVVPDSPQILCLDQANGSR